MKKKNIFLLLMMAGMAIVGCTDDLDQKPMTDSDTTADEVFSTPEGYKSALAKLYASYVIAGQEQGGGNADLTSNNGYDFLRGYFNLQEDATEEVASTWLSGDKVTDLTYMSWDANDPWVADTYYRLYYTIALCNEFLGHATEGAVSGQKDLTAYRAEARFLRALAYEYVLDLFGQGPYVDETMGVGAYTPECYSNVQLFNYIESELKAISEEGLLDKEDSQFEYGRASKQAAWALLTRLYLNAEVYGAGNHYSDCLTYCHKILQAGFSLEPEYAKLFNASNNLRTNEIIFPFVVDGVNTVSWGATTFIVCGQCGNSSTQDPAKYGLTSGWGMFRVRGELPALFEGEADSRYMFYTDEQTQWFTKAIDDQSQGYFGEKFSNLDDSGVAASNTGAVGASIDYPVVRLAEIYLTAAEAILRGGSLTADGVTYDTQKALELVNAVRSRAYGDSDHGINSAQLNLQYILNERGRELYWEAVRRTDLIRYGQFTGGSYIWQWKGGVLDGRATDSKYNVYPIPTAELSANPNLSNANY
jgi:hypothetical protein